MVIRTHIQIYQSAPVANKKTIKTVQNTFQICVYPPSPLLPPLFHISLLIKGSETTTITISPATAGQLPAN